MHPTAKRDCAYLETISVCHTRRFANSRPRACHRTVTDPVSPWASAHGDECIYVGKNVMTRFDPAIVESKDKGCQLDRVLCRKRRPVRRKDTLDFLSGPRQS